MSSSLWKQFWHEPHYSSHLNACAALLAELPIAAPLIVAIGAQNIFVLRQSLRHEHVGAVAFNCALVDAALMAVDVIGLAAATGATARR